jgi:RNA polymerase sigma-70 factor (ECF subfamily)
MTHSSEQVIDEILVMDCQTGSAKAMETLVARWQRRLWLHAYRLVGDTEGAWDVTQQSWLAIIKGMGRLQDPACFKSWAYRIATNHSVDWIKNRQRNRHGGLEDIQNPAPAPPGDSGVRELMEKMDLKNKVVLSLYYFEALSVSEIGMVLKIPRGTVKSRLHTAKNELKCLWRKYLDQ